ncbi:hypothetical protein SAMN02745248_02428 [Hathewaya proteolytica DSM 3090]|uniref:Uncharacterized protein n=1 Tax=Hathewaya proteolytica DSM 3090 TaxID=1121331 RepID=A0A1M6S1N6_9CLOT|nr:hypothetical protein [Hathewaya proteolytica]SHK38744.1 hypothetical protein SAMN02745248_02428 [Hathewaya proteolytica DSM 3090]
MNEIEKLIEALKENLNSTVKKQGSALFPTTRNLQLGLWNTDVVLMAKKSCEESTETLEAAVMYQLEPTWENVKNLAQESIETIQMCFNMLNYLEKIGVIVIPEEIRDHNRKIYARGWEVDTSLKLEVKEG